MKTTSHHITVPGGQLYARQWFGGNAAMPPIVLMHDSLGSVDLWRDWPERLAQHLGCRVIAYDRLGFGRSSARDALPSARFINEEAERYFPALYSQLELNEFVLFGHSVGGGMALTTAAQFPQQCRAVVSLAAQNGVEQRTVQGIQDAVRLFQQEDQFKRLEKWHGTKARWVLDAWSKTWLSDTFRDWQLTPSIADVECPVLVIHGENDEYGSQAFPEAIASAVQGFSEMYILENCAHVPHREQPELLLKLVTQFLEFHELSGQLVRLSQ
ncbi:MAG: alpha/beta hydrolase [Xanthomonadales bacterium]|nr:alpha/beta hydrolase [Xanthomonadales bacterium]